MNFPLKPTTLALALGMALAGTAIAQTAPTAAQQKELDSARANLDQAAKRYAELSRKYGGADAPIPYNPVLEKAAVPQEDDIVTAATNLVRRGEA